MEQPRVKAVFFDAVGTLFHLRAPVGEIYLEHARRWGFETSTLDLARHLTDAFRVAFRAQGPLAFPGHPPDRIPELERDWWKAVVSRTFGPVGLPPDFEAFFKDLYDLFRTSEAWRLDPDACRVLEALKDGGLKTGLVTNYDTRVMDVLQSLGIRRLFDGVTVSTLVGAAKPDPLIFLAACRGVSCNPAEAVHIGDDYEEDWQGAIQAGVRAFLFDPTGRDRDRNVPRIRKLADLLTILL